MRLETQFPVYSFAPVMTNKEQRALKLTLVGLLAFTLACIFLLIFTLTVLMNKEV